MMHTAGDDNAPRTMFEKIWQSHLVHQEPDQQAILYVDLHLVHEVTSPQAFEGLRLAGRQVRRLGARRQRGRVVARQRFSP